MSVTENNKTKLLAVVGPTASGKTALAVELALRYGGEIISCDSVQVYKGLDIGSAKVTAEEARGVRHHLIDAVSPCDDFSCAEYSELAGEAIKDIVSRGRLPVFCGGTGLYLNTVLRGSALSEAGKDDEYRQALTEKYTPAELHGMLGEIDPESAAAIHENNVKRVVRALEIYHVTGMTKTHWDELSRKEAEPFDSVVIGLDYRSRDTLYRRIDQRVDIMLSAGLESEVAALDSPGFRASTASQGIGYKELLAYRDGRYTLPEAVEAIKKGSRNYAKRQLTWFRRDPRVQWIYPDDAGDGDALSFVTERAQKIIKDAWGI